MSEIKNTNSEKSASAFPYFFRIYASTCERFMNKCEKFYVFCTFQYYRQAYIVCGIGNGKKCEYKK